MKVRLKQNYALDATHTLLAGAILEVLAEYYGCGDNFYRVILSCGEDYISGGRLYDGTQQVISTKIVEIIDYTPIRDWEEIRLKVATSIMPDMYASQYYDNKTMEELADMALKQADIFVERYKKRTIL